MRINSKFRGFAAAVVAAVMLAAAVPSHAAEPEPIPVSHHGAAAAQQIHKLPPGITVPHYSAGAIPFNPGERLVYKVTWLGIPAAHAIIAMGDGHDSPGMLTAQAWVNTTPVVDLLFKMRDYMREDLSKDPLKSRQIYIKQNENSRHDQYVIRFDPTRHLVTAVKHSPRGKKVKEFRSENPFGPLSGTLMALSQPLTVGQSLTFDIFTGTSRYVVDFKVDGHDQITTPVGTFKALRVTPSVLYYSDNKQRSATRATTLWISDDKRHLPLRLESQVFVGSMRAELVQVDGAGSPRASRAGHRGQMEARSPTGGLRPASAVTLAD